MLNSAASRWWLPVALGLGMVGFVVSSYPMMRPGFDVWWHLGAIEAPQQLDPSVFPVRRVLWHHFWHGLFKLLQLQDPFARALVIHRTQFLVTAMALVVCAYLLLRVLIPPARVDQASVWLAALLSCVVWLCMSGTRSSAHDGGPGAEVSQSWVLWYSVNYQISLPLVLLAMALLIGVVNPVQSGHKRWALGCGAIASLLVATLVHVAEVAYFLLFSVLVVLLLARGRRAWAVATGLLAASLVLIFLGLQHAYAVPKLLTVLLKGDLLGALVAIQEEGEMLRQTGLTRIDTGWHALHAVSLLCLGMGLLYWRRRGGLDVAPGQWKVGAAVLLTAAFPLALMTSLGAGLFSFLTYSYIAWRFSFASLLFIGVPFAALAWYDWSASRRGKHLRQLALVGLVALVCGLAVWIEDQEGAPAPGLAFAKSLVNSLAPKAVYFGLSAEQQSSLHALSNGLKARSNSAVLCTDIFTSYYLFFLERYPAVSLPPALAYLPGYTESAADCAFPSDNPSLRDLGLTGVPAGADR